MPNVAVHDIAVQAEAKDILLGTHGRSIYKANIAPLQQMNASKMNASILLFKTESVRYSSRWGSSRSKWSQAFEPSTTFKFYANTSENLTIKIVSESGIELNTISVKTDIGFNYTDYDLTITEKGRKAFLKENTDIKIKKAKNGNYYLPKGKYTIQIGSEKTALEVK